MKVQILEEATADLADGYRFYERQTEGLGEYFLDSLWSRCKFVGILLGGIRSDRTRFLRKPFCNGADLEFNLREY